jgi:hypothetical protein
MAGMVTGHRIFFAWICAHGKQIKAARGMSGNAASGGKRHQPSVASGSKYR